MLSYLWVLLQGSDQRTLSDEEVIAEYLRTQNNFFFELLYERYSKKVFGKCLTILKDEAKAQDATQDIMMKVLLNLSRFGGRSKFSTWLYSITYNFCIDYVRKLKKDPSVYMDDIGNYEGEEIEVSDAVILESK
ncbi:MAG: sigma-70 family RNA polymerase sigma factor, partial [Bacteroidota bacterium]